MHGIQHASEEELRISRNTNGDYDIVVLKPSGHLVIDVAIQNIFIHGHYQTEYTEVSNCPH